MTYKKKVLSGFLIHINSNSIDQVLDEALLLRRSFSCSFCRFLLFLGGVTDESLDFGVLKNTFQKNSASEGKNLKYRDFIFTEHMKWYRDNYDHGQRTTYNVMKQFHGWRRKLLSNVQCTISLACKAPLCVSKDDRTFRRLIMTFFSIYHF